MERDLLLVVCVELVELSIRMRNHSKYHRGAKAIPTGLYKYKLKLNMT